MANPLPVLPLSHNQPQDQLDKGASSSRDAPVAPPIAPKGVVPPVLPSKDAPIKKPKFNSIKY